MAEEQELTPEEKLLKVIQKDDTVASDASSVATVGDEKDAAPIAKSGMSGDSPVSLSVINKVLVLAALVAIGFSGYEIYDNMPKEEIVFDATDLNLSGDDQAGLGASLGDTLDMFDDIRITGIPPDPWDPKKGKKPIAELKGWRAYVRDNFKVLASSTVMKQMADGSKKSVVEAIVMDTKEKKMHFLQVGNDITILENKVRVNKISDKTVELVCEEESQIIGEKAKK